jgi:aryl-alcohol dehydrogenase-like predicted oxidoreductase
MQKRKLGNSGIEVPPFGFGGNVFGWTADEKRSFELLDSFVDAGFSLIDTADVYSCWVPGHKGGESETVIGNWLRKSGKRDRVVIATKVGHEMTPNGQGLKRDHILKSVDESLRRLQTDYIDLYQSHMDDPKTPIHETLETYASLVKSGKVRAIGASNFSATRLLESLKLSREHGFPRYETLQPRYNLCDRADYEKDLQDLCVREGLGVINYYSLAAGFLTGKYRSEADLNKSARGKGTVSKYLNERGRRILAALDEVSKRLHANPTRVSIAWLLTRPGIAAPLASATSLDQLREIIAGVSLKLDSDALAVLDRASVSDS